MNLEELKKGDKFVGTSDGQEINFEFIKLVGVFILNDHIKLRNLDLQCTLQVSTRDFLSKIKNLRKVEKGAV